MNNPQCGIFPFNPNMCLCQYENDRFIAKHIWRSGRVCWKRVGVERIRNAKNNHSSLLANCRVVIAWSLSVLWRMRSPFYLFPRAKAHLPMALPLLLKIFSGLALKRMKSILLHLSDFSWHATFLFLYTTHYKGSSFWSTGGIADEVWGNL